VSTNPGHLRRILGVAFLTGLLTWWASAPKYEDFLSKVKSAAGPVARDCGTVRRCEPATGAVACASEALDHGQPFFVVLERGGVDSRIFVAVVAPDPHQLLRIVWNDDVLGLPLLPWPWGFISQRECESAAQDAIARCVVFRIDEGLASN
jgi:hypothetical protein